MGLRGCWTSQAGGGAGGIGVRAVVVVVVVVVVLLVLAEGLDVLVVAGVFPL